MAKKERSAIIEYLATIGAKGGAKGKGNPKRKRLNRKAAKASWSPEARAKRAANRALKKKLKINV